MGQTKKAASFSEKMVQILNDGSLNLAMGLGYRLGLFDVMDAEGRPFSLDEISSKAGLNTRYVNEWLGVMVCGGVIELVAGEDGQPLFFLPEDHGDVLTRRAGSQNLGVYTQEIPLLTACAMEAVRRGFLTGDGIPYEAYPDFHDFMGELADAKHRRILVDHFLPSVNGGRLLRDLRQGIAVCDVGCAQGLALLLMAEAFPASRFTGIDISVQALETANASAQKMGLNNVMFERRNAADLANASRLTGRFDYVIAFDAIHDQARPLDALRGIHAILKEDGAFSMIDIAAQSGIAGNRDHPMGAFLYTVSLMHCMPVGLADGGAGLGMMWGRQKAERMLQQAGFRRVTVHPIPDDPFNDHFFCQK